MNNPQNIDLDRPMDSKTLARSPSTRNSSVDQIEIDYGSLSEMIGFLVTIARADVFEKFYAMTSDLDIGPFSAAALIIIHKNAGIRHGALASALRTKLSHTTKMLNELERRGLVQRECSDSDRRAFEFSLTAEGRTFTKKLETSMLLVDSRIDENLTEAESRRLKQLIRKMLRPE